MTSYCEDASDSMGNFSDILAKNHITLNSSVFTTFYNHFSYCNYVKMVNTGTRVPINLLPLTDCTLATDFNPILAWTTTSCHLSVCTVNLTRTAYKLSNSLLTLAAKVFNHLASDKPDALISPKDVVEFKLYNR